jgi:hypothetical protein
MGNPVVHFEVYGKNHKKQVSFYQKMFGWKTQQYMPGYAMVKKAGKDGIGGGIGEGPKSVLVYVQVKNLEKALAQATKLGGKVHQKPMAIEGAGIRIAIFKDPAGNQIGLVQ